MTQLNDKVALVTDGTSGIGKASAIANLHPMQQFSIPEEIANAVVFLSSSNTETEVNHEY